LSLITENPNTIMAAAQYQLKGEPVAVAVALEYQLVQLNMAK
jgi:hypothetical protein